MNYFYSTLPFLLLGEYCYSRFLFVEGSPDIFCAFSMS